MQLWGFWMLQEVNLISHERNLRGNGVMFTPRSTQHTQNKSQTITHSAHHHYWQWSHNIHHLHHHCRQGFPHQSNPPGQKQRLTFEPHINGGLLWLTDPYSFTFFSRSWCVFFFSGNFSRGSPRESYGVVDSVLECLHACPCICHSRPDRWFRTSRFQKNIQQKETDLL